ncbi:MAG TPA: hypothetical protein VFF08_06665 [Trueperaceae bacterium]|nr:hypothetical protein [Trueperaceae bacterium]
MPLDSQVEELVARVHGTPHMGVLAFAGAGSQALAWLHAVGGSSRTVMSAVDVYHEQSMRRLLGFMPARFTSRRVARLMADAAYDLAREYRARSERSARQRLLVGSAFESDAELAAAARAASAAPMDKRLPVFGLGSTATIATDRAKRGDHRVACAVRDGLGSVTYALTIEKGARDREGEETLVSLVMLDAVSDACGVFGTPPLPLTEGEELRLEYRPAELLEAVSAGTRGVAVATPDGRVISGDGLGPRTVLSGSFNPVHDGHWELAEAASRHTGLPALFELPLLNAAKAPIELVVARKRALQFAGRAPIALSRAPLFAQKAELFPGSVFVVGVDTAERIVDTRFYEGDPAAMRSALETVRARGCRFLVAGRESGGEYRTLAHVPVPEGFRDLFEALPEGQFRRDISSTEIRSRWATEWS